MRRFFFCMIALAFTIAATQAQSLSPSDASAVRAVISDQLAAFAADNGDAAYKHAAPIVKGVFPNVDIFMAMVKQGYQPVYRNKAFEFGDGLIDNLGRPAQRVVLTAMDGKRYEALYSMERQPNGTWKIAGVVLIAVPGLDV